MKRTIIAAFALSLGLGGAAVAQTMDADSSASAATSGVPMEFQGEIGSAFYSDTQNGTLRSQDEIRSNWGNLSVEQQAQVRAKCANLASTDATGAVDGTASILPDAESDVDAGLDTGTTASTTPDAGSQQASVGQICDTVEGM